MAVTLATANRVLEELVREAELQEADRLYAGTIFGRLYPDIGASEKDLARALRERHGVCPTHGEDCPFDPPAPACRS